MFYYFCYIVEVEIFLKICLVVKEGNKDFIFMEECYYYIGVVIYGKILFVIKRNDYLNFSRYWL